MIEQQILKLLDETFTGTNEEVASKIEKLGHQLLDIAAQVKRGSSPFQATSTMHDRVTIGVRRNGEVIRTVKHG